MLLGTWVIIVVSALYVIAGIAYIWQRQYGSALMFLSYALANIGFFWQTGAFK